jgi:hypothetical protein
MSNTKENKDRNRRILAVKGKKSFGLIALDLGITRNIVAGVCFRASHPFSEMVSCTGARQRTKLGTGYRNSNDKRASKNMVTKLTYEKVLEIRSGAKDWAACKKFAKKYGVTTQAVWYVALGKSWKNA